jgi:triosephosphate isomerase
MMNRQLRMPVIAGNWKMNLGGVQTKALLEALLPLVGGEDCRVVVCPPFTSLAAAAMIRDSRVALGAQNCHWEPKGAFTGEISADMLRELDVSYVIVGHSERRQYFGETDRTAGLRLRAALRAGLTPILCVGERLEEREAGLTDRICAGQIEGALKGLPPEDIERVVVAYEPVWAIGTGRTATAQQANETIGVIRGALKSLFGADAAQRIPILYGGSMNAQNAAALLAQPEIDGGLIGGASLKAEDFAAIVAACTEGRE